MAHEWGPTVQFPDAYAHHGRECTICGFRQEYGKRFGSNRYPGYARAPDVCDPVLNEGGRDWKHLSLAVRLKYRARRGSAAAADTDGGSGSSLLLLLPPLTQTLLNVAPILRTMRHDADTPTPPDTDVASGEMLAPHVERFGGLAGSLPMRPATRHVPDNLGTLGEAYAFQLLSQAGWAKPGSARWLNEDAEGGQHWDLECEHSPQSGIESIYVRKYIEVKTHWGKGNVALSPKQRELLSDPTADFCVMIINRFANMYDAAGAAPPEILIVHPPTPTIDHLLKACTMGDIERVRWLLGENSALATERSPKGLLPVFAAASGGHLAVVKLLMENGASLTAENVTEHLSPTNTAVNEEQERIRQEAEQKAAAERE